MEGLSLNLQELRWLKMTPQRIYFNRNDVDLFKRSYLRSKQEILKQLMFKDVADLTFFSEEIMNIVEGKSYKMSNYKHSGVIIFNCATGSHVCCRAYVKYKKEDGYFVYCSHLGQHSLNCSGNGGSTSFSDENLHSTFATEKDKPILKKQRTLRLPKEQVKKLPKNVVANKISTSLKSPNSNRPRKQRVATTLNPVPSSSSKELRDPKVNTLVYCGLFYHTWKKGKASNLPIKSDLHPSNAANAIQNHQYHAADYSDSDDQSLVSLCSLSSGKYPRTPIEAPQSTINSHDSKLPISSSFHLTHFLLRKMQCVAAATAIQQVVAVCDWTMQPDLANRCLQCQCTLREKLLRILEIEKLEAEQHQKQLNEDKAPDLETQTLFTSEGSPCSSSFSSSSSSALAINLVQSTPVSSKDTTISRDNIEKSHYFHFLLQLIDVLLFPFRTAPIKDDTSVDSDCSDDSMETLLQSNREQLIYFMEELIHII